MKEIWKDIKGYEGLYQVSNWGRVKSVDRWVKHKNNSKRFVDGKIKDLQINKSGYCRITLCKNSKAVSHLVHRLVAEAFIDNPDNLAEINHKDEVKTNNHVENLEWCNHLYNSRYGTRAKRLLPYLNIARLKSNVVLSKQVCQFDLNGNLIKTYNSTHETKKDGFTQGNVSKCCRGEINTYRGFIWKYAS